MPTFAAGLGFLAPKTRWSLERGASAVATSLASQQYVCINLAWYSCCQTLVIEGASLCLRMHKREGGAYRISCTGRFRIGYPLGLRWHTSLADSTSNRFQSHGRRSSKACRRALQRTRVKLGAGPLPPCSFARFAALTRRFLSTIYATTALILPRRKACGLLLPFL